MDQSHSLPPRWEIIPIMRQTHPCSQPQGELALVPDGEEAGDRLAGRCHKLLHDTVMHHVPLLDHLPQGCRDEPHGRSEELERCERKAGSCGQHTNTGFQDN